MHISRAQIMSIYVVPGCRLIFFFSINEIMIYVLFICLKAEVLHYFQTYMDFVCIYLYEV